MRKKTPVLLCTKCTLLVSWTLIHAKVQCLVLELGWIETNLPISTKPAMKLNYQIYHEKLDLPPPFHHLSGLSWPPNPPRSKGRVKNIPNKVVMVRYASWRVGSRWPVFTTKPRGWLTGKSTRKQPKTWFYMGLGVFPVGFPFVEFWATRSLGLPNHDGRLA